MVSPAGRYSPYRQSTPYKHAPLEGHGFDRIDSKEATDIRFTVHKFMERYLKPPHPFASEKEMRGAAYGF